MFQGVQVLELSRLFADSLEEVCDPAESLGLPVRKGHHLSADCECLLILLELKDTRYELRLREAFFSQLQQIFDFIDIGVNHDSNSAPLFDLTIVVQVLLQTKTFLECVQCLAVHFGIVIKVVFFFYEY